MKKIDLGQTVTVLANVGVIAGIVFLAYEIRQNTTAVQASTLLGMVDISSDFMVDVSIDSEFMEVVLRGQAAPDQLSDVEQAKLALLIKSIWFRYQGAFIQWQRGSLSNDDWEVYEPYVCQVPSPFLVRLWPSERGFLTEDFVTYVESCRSED